jgi:mannitol operon transcriptional antiterminator
MNILYFVVLRNEGEEEELILHTPILSTRQEELLRTLLFSPKPISYKQLSDLFKLSTRTIRREITSLKSILKNYNLKITKKIGSGIFIDGTVEEKRKLERDLKSSKAFVIFSQEERRDGILYDLLMASEPIKYFFLSNKYGVTEATISNDLEKLEPWCKNLGLTIVRKPGMGIFIEGPEHKKRMAISRLLHKDITFEEWFELFQLSKQEEYTIDTWKLGNIIHKRLRKFIHTPNILIVEQTIKEVLESQTTINLSDRNYVNLVIHLLLAIERIKFKKSDRLEEHNIIPNIENIEEYAIAKKIVHKLEEKLQISIPKVEISYITLHLLGSRFNHHSLLNGINQTDIEWFDLTKSFIRTVERYLSISIREDLILFDGLLSHLVPAISRLMLGLQIHNPMLEEIKKHYSQVFLACQKAAQVLSNKIGRDIPEDEIGYLAIHVGASIIRVNENSNKIYKAIIVCASGMGTSTFLSSKISKEIPNLKIEKVLSVIELKKWIERNRENKSVDIVISTVSLPFMDPDQYVVVSPFLHEDELRFIQKKLSQSYELRKENVEEKDNNLSSISTIVSAMHGEAMVQILRNLVVLNHVELDRIEVSYSILQTLVDHIKHLAIINNEKQFLNDLEKRERQGHFIYNGLAMVHAKSSGVEELLVSLFRLNHPIEWGGQQVCAFLLLAAPMDAPKEHIEMISEISSNLIEESFLNVLINGTEREVKKQLENLLSEAYLSKVRALLKEPDI